MYNSTLPQMASQEAAPWASAALPRNLTEHYLPVPLDHAAPWNGRTLSLRYLMDTSYLTRDGPLITYTGNEADIEGFAASCGFLWVLARRFGGAVIFIEERYYGKSLPVPVAGEREYAFLSSAQVVEDFVDGRVGSRERGDHRPMAPEPTGSGAS